MENKNDKETSEIMNELKEITDFTQSKGFEIIQRRLIEKIQLLSDVGTFDLSDPQQLVIEFKARQIAMNLITQWWQEDVVGSGSQYMAIKEKTFNKPWLIKED